MTSTTFSIPDMHCANCANRIRDALTRLEGVQTLRVNPVRRQLIVSHEAPSSPFQLISELESIGFHPALSDSTRSAAVNGQHRDLLKRLGIAGIAAMQVMMTSIALYLGDFSGMEIGYRRLLEVTSLIFCIPVVTYSAVPFFSGALRSLKNGINMDVPVAVAIAAAFLTSLTSTFITEGDVYYDSVVMFTFLLLGSRYLSERLRARLSDDQTLLSTLPQTVRTRTAAGVIAKPAAELAIGEEVLVAQGQCVPADGTLCSARAKLEEAALTGESEWVERCAGDSVHAGTFNRGSEISFVVTAAGQDTKVAGINLMADAIEAAGTPVQLLIDRIARHFLTAVLGLAAATLLGWLWIDPQTAIPATLAVLVVSCPCALALASPAAMSAALSRARRAGILIRSPELLEGLATAHKPAFFFDKTGTLTEPGYERVRQYTAPGLDPHHVLKLAAGLEQAVTHPLATAFSDVEALPVTDIDTGNTSEVRGRFGTQQLRISGEAPDRQPDTQTEADAAGTTEPGKTLYFYIDSVLAATFTLRNALKPDAAITIDALRKQGISATILSGDNNAQCAAIAGRLGITAHAGCTAETKHALLRSAQERGEFTVFVGDGFNDVPALAGADVSISMLETSDVVRTRADALLGTRRLSALPALLDIARSTRRVTRQNLIWALVYNATAIPVAISGLLPPWLAALGMSLSALLVMLNATRLLHIRTADLTTGGS